MNAAPRRRALAAAASLVLTAGTPCVVRAQTTEYRVVFATARELARRLDEAGADGYDCLAVARPEPELVQQGVAVVLGRASAGGPATRHRVVSASGRASDLQPLLDKAGPKASGCVASLCRRDPRCPRWQAVTTGAPTPAPSGGATASSPPTIESGGRLAAGALEGFRPVALRSSPTIGLRRCAAGSSSASGRRTAARRTRRCSAAPGPDGLQKALTEQAGKGFASACCGRRARASSR